MSRFIYMGFTPSLIERHGRALRPLFGFTVLGGVIAFGYLGRLALKNPDCTWNNKTNPEPWQRYSDKQYKFYRVNLKADQLRQDPEKPKF